MTKTQKCVLRWTLSIVSTVIFATSIGFLMYCRKLDTFQRCKFTRRSIKEVQNAVTIYAVRHNGQIPATLGELTRSSNEQRGLLNESGLIDCWGTPLLYETHLKSFTITSAGPDKKLGTKDDITNH
jgi:hypothetical protein